MEKNEGKITIVMLIIMLFLIIFIGGSYYLLISKCQEYENKIAGLEEELRLQNNTITEISEEDKNEVSENNKYFEKNFHGVTVNGPLFKFYENGNVVFYDNNDSCKYGTYDVNEENIISIKFTKKEDDIMNTDSSVITPIDEKLELYYLPDNDERVLSVHGYYADSDIDDYVYIENLIVY